MAESHAGAVPSPVPHGWAAPRTVAYVLKGYPRLSELFIASEIHRVEEQGVAVRLFGKVRRPYSSINECCQSSFPSALKQERMPCVPCM